MRNKEFTILYTKYRRMVMKIAYKKLHDYDLAQEIAQQVFTVFYQEMDRVNAEFYKGWMILTTKNAVIDYMRKQDCRRRYYAPYEQDDHTSKDYRVIAEDNTEMIVERMACAQLSFRILQDVRKKNLSWYQALEAVCVYEMSSNEAAEYLNITPTALRARLYRARKYIREVYAEEYREYYMQ